MLEGKFAPMRIRVLVIDDELNGYPFLAAKRS